MPRGGNHGGGRPKLPPELKAKTYSYCFSPILGDAIAALGEKKIAHRRGNNPKAFRHHASAMGDLYKLD